MDFEIPKWLTKDFIKNALEDGKEDKVTIEDFKVEMPIAKGNNYLCDIFKITTSFRKSSDYDNVLKTSLIAKSPMDGPIHKIIKEVGIYDRETLVYSELSKKLKSIFNEVENEEDTLLPESYLSTEDNVIVMDDLIFKGYEMVDRIKQLDYNHCVIALKTLAKFHAGSVLIFEKEPQLIERIGENIIFTYEMGEVFSSFINPNFKILANILKEIPELVKYSNWFEENWEKGWDITVKSIDRNNSEFNVLSHCDYWLMNVLFKYDSNKVPIKAKLIDFQFVVYASPVIDFMNFMDTSVQENVRSERFDDLMNVYVKELNDILTNYGSSKRLELLDFKKSLKEHASFLLYVNLAQLPPVIADPNDVKQFDGKEISMDSLSDTENSLYVSYMKNEKIYKYYFKKTGRI